MGKSHVAFSAMLTAAALPLTNAAFDLGLSPAEMAIGVGISAVAGVLPDIDHPNSLITQGIVPGSKMFGPVGRGAGWFLCLPPRLVGVGARATMNHRGGTHSLLFAVIWALFAAPFYALTFTGLAFILSIILSPVAGLLGLSESFNPGVVWDWFTANLTSIMLLVTPSVFFGYIGHLIADSMTKVPVPWPWPFSARRLFLLPKPLRITTGSFTESALLRPIFVVFLLVFFIWGIGIPLANQLIDSGQKQIESREEANPAAEQRKRNIERYQRQQERQQKRQNR